MWFACLPVAPPSGGNIFKYMPHSMLPHFEPRVNSFHGLQSDLLITGHIYRLWQVCNDLLHPRSWIL